jgi:tetratricopeptide (TPR) repeat protein
MENLEANVDSFEDAEKWLADNITENNRVDDDFGLYKIAVHFGKEDAVKLYWEGAATEETGDIASAINLYKRAFRLWPALDSVTHGGLPRAVREEAETAGFSCDIAIIDVPAARASRVRHARGLLDQSDLAQIEAIRQIIAETESPLQNNPQNTTHKLKVCTFMNNPPDNLFRNKAPIVLSKMLNFAMRAWEEEDWSGSVAAPGPLHNIAGGVQSLSIRVVEHWEYSVGGGLVDPFHYDVDSVLTIVALLVDPDEFEGGTFRTNELDDRQLEHPMHKGDVICFLSHKFHNIVPLTKGVRRSLVMELWQGGDGHAGR